jgi:hypothetical protein
MHRADAEKLAPISPQMKFVTVPKGGHYAAMIEQGIPKGIEWLRGRNPQRQTLAWLNRYY